VNPGEIPSDLRKQIIERDEGRCQFCRLSQDGQSGRFHIDHVIPRGAGGVTEASNLVLACVHCNLRKATKLMGVDQMSGTSVALFHPLRQQWNEHFIMRVDGTCVGVTPAGRATVAALCMNDEIALVARRMQIFYGLLSATEQQRN
jgi:hypothetical protein